MLGLDSPPIAVTFLAEGASAPAVAAFDEPMSEPTADGRSGRVPASCVFWSKAFTSTFSTLPADHGNCSVGRWVHGFAALEAIAGADDVGLLFSSGWVTSEDVSRVEVITEPAERIVYGPLSEATASPNVVVLHLNPRQMMALADAVPGVELNGKPQCQIVARAKAGRASISMGCALSRERTAMSEADLTCAIPGAELGAVVERLRAVTAADTAVRDYAGNDLSRFDSR